MKYNLTKITSIVAIGLITTPIIAFAAFGSGFVWWNPMTWFSKPASTVVNEKPFIDESKQNDNNTTLNNGSSSSVVSDADTQKAYIKYCTIVPTFSYSNTDYSNDFMNKLNSMSLSDLEKNLLSSKYNDAQLPEAIYYIGLKLTQTGNLDDGISFYKCAAEKYYDIYAAYKIASLYEKGTDSLVQQLKSNFPNVSVTKNKLPIDYDKQYYWVLVTVGISLFDVNAKSFFDTSTQLGWNINAMFDDLENTKKVKGDKKLIDSNATEFLAKRYPDILKLKNSLDNKVINKSASTSTIKDQVTSNVPTTLYTDSKNGFSIDQPKGWEVHTTGGPQGTLIYFSDPKDSNNKLEVAYSNAVSDPVKSLNDIRSLYGRLGTISDDKNITLGSYSGTYINLLLNDKAKGTKKQNRMAAVYVSKDGRLYHSSFIIDDASWMANKDTFEKVLFSLRFTK